MAQRENFCRLDSGRKAIRLKLVLDSTVLVSIFSDQDKFHKRGLSLYSDILDGKIEAIIPTLALPETCGVIKRVFGEHAAVMVEGQLKTLIENGMISAKELTADRMWDAAEDCIRFSIRGGDSIFVSLTRETGSHLMTFDDELKKKINGKVKVMS